MPWNTALTSQAVSRITSWLRQSKMIALVESIVEEIQEAEDTAQAIVLERLLDTAEGVQLDAYGVLARVRRGTLDDDDYRAILKATFAANASQTTTNELAFIIGALFSGTAHIVQQYPASYLVNIIGGVVNAERITFFYNLFERFTAAGVGTDGVWVEPEFPFGWEEDPDAFGWGVGDWVEQIIPRQ